MEQQFAVTHTIRQNEIPALLDGLKTHLPSKGLPTKIGCPYIFRKKNTYVLVH
jgi:hypothetical protein